MVDTLDLSFVVGLSTNPLVILDSDLRVVALNSDAQKLHLDKGQSIFDALAADVHKRETIQQCLGSTSKRRFSVGLKEGYDIEVIGSRLGGPFKMQKLIMLQFVDLLQVRANFLACTTAVRNRRTSLALTRKNETLEARIAKRNAELEELNATLETKVVERTAELTLINEELEELTYIVTHDLKVPITNLSQLTEMLTSDAESFSAEQNEIIGWMRTSCTQAYQKLESLMDVAQARTAELSPCEPIELADVFDAACDGLKPQIEAHGAVVTADFDAAPQIQYLQYESTSLMENLIGNAIKYAHPDRAPRIELRSWTLPNFVCLAVRDNGSGLNLPDDEKKVFGMFKRAHVEPPGSGIALYSIRKKIDRYGGRVMLDSVLGEWTEFTFMFPDQTVATKGL